MEHETKFIELPSERRTKLIRKLRWPLAVTAMALGIGGGLSADINNGSLKHFEGPPAAGNRTGGYESGTDNQLVVVSYNTAAKPLPELSKDIETLIEKYHPDFINLQEIHSQDIEQLIKVLPGWEAYAAEADRFVDFTDGFFGNAILAPEKLGSADMLQLEGYFKWGSVLDFKKAYQERRAIMSTYKTITVGGVALRVNIINTHLAGDPKTAKSQRQSIVPFIKAHRGKDNELALVSGDLNAKPPVVKKIFGGEWIVADIGQTSVNQKQQIDHFIFSPIVWVDGEPRVLDASAIAEKEVHSDHYAVVFTATLSPPPKYVATVSPYKPIP